MPPKITFGGISFVWLWIDLCIESAETPCTEQGTIKMMLLIFVCMTLALALGWYGYRALAVICVFLCLAVATKEFLWEIHSSEYGYSMPWLQL